MKKEMIRANNKNALYTIVIILFIALFLLFILAFSTNFILDGKAIAPPPTTPGRPDRTVCGNGDCEGGEDYYDCPKDCCGEKGDQVRTASDCCSGLTAVKDVCEFEEFPSGQAIAPPQEPPVELCWFCVDCGNKKCEAHETSANCIEDCRPICGNNICDVGEDYTNCPTDCCATEGTVVPIPGHCCKGLRAISPCYPNTPCLAFGWICTNCGDKFCKDPETPYNCPEDCGPICGNALCEENENYLNCPVDCEPVCGNTVCETPLETYQNCNEDCCAPASSAVMPPYNCCDGLKLVEFIPPKDGGIPISQKYCVDCGNHLCEEYETIDNCPEDCATPIDCSLLPPIKAQVEYDEIKDLVNLAWEYPKGAVVKSQTLNTAKRCKTIKGEGNEEGDAPDCEWTIKEIDKNERELNEPGGTAEPIKFYKIAGIAELGCKPICMFEGTKSEGWYDSCDGNLIKYDVCAGAYAECKYIGSESEGWYKTSMMPIEELIIYDECSKKIVECPMESEAFVKFTQIIFKQPSQPRDAPRTNINWIINIYGEVPSYELMERSRADYVSQWFCSQQRFVGTARGRGPKDVVTGVFTMQQGYPYSLSSTIGDIGLTYVTKLPDHLTFNFCPGANYLSLPLDTKLDKASQLCDSLGLLPDDSLGYWDVQNQKIMAHLCGEIRAHPQLDFNVYPGNVYFFMTSTAPISWKQE
ncbi:MAG: hypothetical protein K6T16_00010 [Candidatus Pacearchaeota archaeon]|nr:hypothetical protein [Candidatus Pacearchaeota archaeon]